MSREVFRAIFYRCLTKPTRIPNERPRTFLTVRFWAAAMTRFSKIGAIGRVSVTLDEEASTDLQALRTVHPSGSHIFRRRQIRHRRALTFRHGFMNTGF